jgi:hypothetical protein
MVMLLQKHANSHSACSARIQREKDRLAEAITDDVVKH